MAALTLLIVAALVWLGALAIILRLTLARAERHAELLAKQVEVLGPLLQDEPDHPGLGQQTTDDLSDGSQSASPISASLQEKVRGGAGSGNSNRSPSFGGSA